jgi:sterol desaturase/sphingolipid hydroxylase (fatty acid hydroxylase superfamily)
LTIAEARPPASSTRPVRPGPVDEVDSRPTRARGWIGVVAIGGAVVWLGVVGAQALVGSGDLSRTLATAQARTAGPVLVAVIALLVLAERRWPAVPRPLLARAHLVDAGYFALFAVAVVPLLTVVETGSAVEVGRHASFLLVGRLSLVPRVVAVIAILVGIDAMNWAAHVANHRATSLWRLHALHHSQEDMSVLTTFRTHPLVHATYLGALLPALVLGASGTVPSTALVVYGCLVTLPHANLRWSFGPLGRVVVSPAYHRLHHARTPLDSRGTVNFGFVLVCWDRLARLAMFPSAGPPIATGIAGRPVPVEQRSPSGPWRVVAAQLAQPFRMHRSMDGRP